MKQEVAQAWAADLRKGPKQGRGQLGDAENGYCCLGRLCIVMNEEFQSDQEVLAGSQILAAGMNSRNGIFNIPGDQHPPQDHLASVNDNGLTFHQIADLIDYFWEEL